MYKMSKIKTTRDMVFFLSAVIAFSVLPLLSKVAIGSEPDGIYQFRHKQILIENRGGLEFKSDKKIYSNELVNLNGHNHAINIRSENINNPVILYLHGGPGWPVLPYAYKFSRLWEKDFTVVHWDQRGAGKTHCANPKYNPVEARFEDFLSDTEAVVGYLREKLGQKKIIIVGHSWGSLLGVHFVKNHPNAVAAYVGTGQIAFNWEQEKAGYDFALGQAYARNDEDAIQRLESLSPYPDVDKYMDKMEVQRDYIIRYGGALVNRDSYMDYYYSAFFESPDYTLSDWVCAFDAMQNYYHEALEERQYSKDSDIGNLPALGLDFEVPVFFFLGAHDQHISSRIGIEYFRDIKAPHKRLVLFDGSAHAPPIEQPEEFYRALRDHVLPLVISNQAMVE